MRCRVRNRNRAPATKRVLDVLRAGPHHLFPHRVGMALLIEKRHGFLRGEITADAGGYLRDVGKRNLGEDSFSRLAIRHTNTSPCRI
jgi:hypothetical protein